MNFIKRWFDNTYGLQKDSTKTDWSRIDPFIFLHLSCLLVFFCGISKAAVIVALFLYWLRIFSIGAFYHRYFSHKTFKPNRFWQFIFAILGALSAQRGPIWWAAHHCYHHQVSDTYEDPYSSWTQSFWQSHLGWFLSHKYFHYDKGKVKDLLKFFELCWLDRFDELVPISLIVILFLLGEVLTIFFPALKCNGFQLVVWTFAISTVATLHTTVSINSLNHKYSSRRYATKDQSRNNFLLALLTFGEGWHNNHYRYPATARQGFGWWDRYNISLVSDNGKVKYHS